MQYQIPKQRKKATRFLKKTYKRWHACGQLALFRSLHFNLNGTSGRGHSDAFLLTSALLGTHSWYMPLHCFCSIENSVIRLFSCNIFLNFLNIFKNKLDNFLKMQRQWSSENRDAADAGSSVVATACLSKHNNNNNSIGMTRIYNHTTKFKIR